SDRRLAPPAAGAGIAGPGGLDHLQQLLLPAPLYPDLRGQAAPLAGLNRVYRDPRGWRHSRDLLAGGRALVRHDPAHAHHAADGVAVLPDLVPGFLSDRSLAVVGDRNLRSRLSQPDQGRV